MLQLITIMVTHGMATSGIPGRRQKTVKLIHLLLLAAALAAPAARARKLAIACSPFVYPCHCGLCPHIVDCKTKVSAECFCGTAAPGSYPHPEDKTKFWMCSYGSRALVRYGVEVACPARLVYDPAFKVCTFPAAAAAAAAPSDTTNSSSKGPETSTAAVPAGASAAATAVPISKTAAASSQSQTASSSSSSSSAKQAQQKPKSRATMVERAPAARKP